MAPILFAKAISKDKSIKVFNNGNLERDFTFVTDIVEGIVRVIDSTPAEKEHLNKVDQEESALYSIYNIGNVNPVKLMDFI